MEIYLSLAALTTAATIHVCVFQRDGTRTRRVLRAVFALFLTLALIIPIYLASGVVAIIVLVPFGYSAGVFSIAEEQALAYLLMTIAAILTYLIATRRFF